MGKFNKLALHGATIIIGLFTMIVVMIVLGVRNDRSPVPMPEQKQIERIIERRVEIRLSLDTVKIPVRCTRKHCDEIQVVQTKSDTLK